VAIARAIVAKKIEAENHSKLIKLDFLKALGKARTTDDIRYVEAKTAQVWWRRWTGFKMLFTGPAVAGQWFSFQSRYIGRAQDRLGKLSAQFTARGAVHPIQVILNFGIIPLANQK